MKKNNLFGYEKKRWPFEIAPDTRDYNERPDSIYCAVETCLSSWPYVATHARDVMFEKIKFSLTRTIAMISDVALRKKMATARNRIHLSSSSSCPSSFFSLPFCSLEQSDCFYSLSGRHDVAVMTPVFFSFSLHLFSLSPNNWILFIICSRIPAPREQEKILQQHALQLLHGH